MKKFMKALGITILTIILLIVVLLAFLSLKPYAPKTIQTEQKRVVSLKQSISLGEAMIRKEFLLKRRGIWNSLQFITQRNYTRPIYNIPLS